MEGPYELTDKDFDVLRDLIYSETGINLSEQKRALVRARLNKRLRFLGLADFSEYVRFLGENYNSERIHLINAITTNKTEFFREIRHFEFIRDVFLPRMDSLDAESLRIWSCGCSTGEEPYSIAITLMEYYRNKGVKSIPDVKILATDIDTQVLDHAIKGIYKYDQASGMGEEVLRRYFLKGVGENEGLLMVKKSLRDLVSFARLNIQDKTYPMKKTFEVIFCRNVIIYFDHETQKQIFKKFYNFLDDNGVLFIGHSENLMRISEDFRLIGNTIYEKIRD